MERVHPNLVSLHDLAKFSNSQRKNKGLGRAERAPNPYSYVKLAKSYLEIK